MEQTEAFWILASVDRQLLLHELLEHEGTAPIDGLSRQVAARRHSVASEKIDDGTIDRARIRLVHSHLPRLEEKRVIDVDWDDEAVSLTRDESVAQLLEAATELESWPPTDLFDRPSR
ncbi:DUF7344 domain-containing protein [Halosolutus gelatinilyticus]|uniref:DUF7344 domain-containing protein n=1 Tax=Halosolutus gelatinilyticus TaxID=2931975 RepID=UPI001FF4D246|nr:hypothetical protein [Halosolutus gelatinilyticus]